MNIFVSSDDFVCVFGDSPVTNEWLGLLGVSEAGRAGTLVFGLRWRRFWSQVFVFVNL